MQSYTAILVLALAAFANAGLPGSPKIFMTVDDTSLSGLESVGLKGTLDLDGIGGDDVQVQVEYDYNDLKMAPSVVSASIDRDVGGMAVNIDAQFNVNDKTVDAKLTAKGDGYDIIVTGDSTDPTPKTVGLATDLTLGGKKIHFKPTANLRTREVDIEADIELVNKATAHVEVNAMSQEGTVELTYEVDSNNSLRPKWATGNKFQYGWTHKFSKDSTLDVSFEPNESVSAEWTEGSWTTTLDTPISNPENSKVSFKREWGL